MAELDWDHLFVNAAQLDIRRIIAPWFDLVQGPIRPIGMSMFGDVYFDRGDDVVSRIDVLEGGVVPVAPSFDEFTHLMNSPEWARDALLVDGVALLRERGLIPGPGECYGFAPHPVWTGSISWEHTVVLSAEVWHAICAQSLHSVSRSA